MLDRSYNIRQINLDKFMYNRLLQHLEWSIVREERILQNSLQKLMDAGKGI